MKLEALIFDVDGTLVDTEELHRQAYNQTFLEFGFGWHWSAASYVELLAVSGGEARVARYIDLIDSPPAEKIRLRRLIPAIHKEKTQLYSELIASNAVKPRPGIVRLIEAARQSDVRVGLVASSASANVEGLVTSALGSELRNVIAAIVCTDMVAPKKPAPDIYELTLTMLRVSAAAAVRSKIRPMACWQHRRPACRRSSCQAPGRWGTSFTAQTWCCRHSVIPTSRLIR